MKIKHLSSFRDNSGFIYKDNDTFYRQINNSFQSHYEHLISSGLYRELVENNQLIPHKEILKDFDSELGYKTILPRQLSFVNFSYCWSFSMLKDAALLTLNIQKTALKYGMTLKDATSFNVQFDINSPVFIDTLSFEKYDGISPWIAYGQFCRHFLAPLALMSYSDISLNSLMMNHLDGIPLELATKILPFKSKLNFGIYIHLFLHNKAQKRFQKETNHTIAKKNTTNNKIIGVIEHLIATVEKLTWKAENTTWDGYYDKWVGVEYMNSKKTAIELMLPELPIKNTLLDLGANDGTFSFLATQYFKNVLSFDIDPACVEQNYLFTKKNKISNLLPLVVDFTNPAPAIGWNNQERSSIIEAIGRLDTIMVLAIIHHLCIGKNIPLDFLASLLAQHTQYLIIEFVPKTDEKVKMLLQDREDIFDTYSIESFTEIFNNYFNIIQKTTLMPTDRMLFLMSKKI